MHFFDAGYGMTETTIVTNCVDDAYKRGSCGQVTKYVTFKVRCNLPNSNRLISSRHLCSTIEL